MDTQEKVGAVIVGDGSALLQPDVIIRSACQDNLDPQPLFDHVLQLFGDAENQLFFQGTGAALGADAPASMSRIQHNHRKSFWFLPGELFGDILISPYKRREPVQVAGRFPAELARSFFTKHDGGAFGVKRN